MAQWEDRDPRWVVNELGKQGSNVNGWHWEDKSKISWSKSKLKELIENCSRSFESGDGQGEIKEVTDVSGEVPPHDNLKL